MPIYEYECTECGHRFEVQQKATARPLRKCPNRNGGQEKCGGTLKKLFFPAAIIFKGSGWHIKDYGKNGANGGNGAGGGDRGKKKDESKSESSASSSSSSDTKSEKKMETKAEGKKERAGSEA